MEMDLNILVLSALLHNIGKFASRANWPSTDEKEHFGGKKLAPDVFNRGSGPRHLLHTDHFIKNDLPLPADMEASRSLIAETAALGHVAGPEADLPLSQACVMIAHRLSSGADPSLPEEASSQQDAEERLVSLFDEIELLNHRFESPGRYVHDLLPLTPDNDAIFPRAGRPEANRQDYESLFKSFLSELNASYAGNLNTLISLLKKYTWCVPLSKSMPDVSLFDHSFGAAGIAQALYLYHRHHGTPLQWADDEAKCVLMTAEITGSRDYVFGIRKQSGPGMSRIFRCRSFFLQTVTQSILIDIHRRLGILPVCRLADSGGRFLLILPLTPLFQESLIQLETDIQFWFRRKFKGLVVMNVSYSTHMRTQDWHLENFQAKMDAANKSLERAKHIQLKKTFAVASPVIQENHDENEGGNCEICGIHAADPEASRKYEQVEHQKIALCPDCCEQIVHMGRRLSKTDYLVYGPDGEIPLFGDIWLTLSGKKPSDTGTRFHVEALNRAGGFNPGAPLAGHLPLMTKEELSDKRWVTLFRQDRTQELIPNQPKSFTMIAHKSKRERQGRLRGRSLLAFFKADLDNRGLIFSMGLAGRMSAARFASLSRMLNLFFSEYLGSLLETEFPDIHVVLVGDDDLFVLGPWRQTLRFSLLLRERLSLFCAQNPDITLSGGLLTAKPGIPMSRAADLVEDNLREAKKVWEPDRIKNSVNFLGHTLSWERFEELITLGRRFDKAVESQAKTKMSTAFLYRLLAYYKMYRKFTHEKKITFGRYLALAHYDIGKNIRSDRKRNQSEVEMLYRIFSVGQSGKGDLDMLNIPLFYAINLNRD